MRALADVSFFLSHSPESYSLRLMKYADGFFDAGMLLQALKAREDSLDNGDLNILDRAAGSARRREVGKKLRLSEY
jgi:hypothetical protein